MHYITVFDEHENHLGWIDAQGKLTTDPLQSAGFSDKDTAWDMCSQLESGNQTWYTQLVENQGDKE